MTSSAATVPKWKQKQQPKNQMLVHIALMYLTHKLFIV